jgi:hypothetical protein
MPFRVHGAVLERESGRPLAGLVVRAFDDDLLFDDFLGDARTDAGGEFEVVYTEVQFQDLHETRPDVYVRVFDASGTRLLHTTETRHRAALDERFEIRIGRSELAGA